MHTHIMQQLMTEVHLEGLSIYLQLSISIYTVDRQTEQSHNTQLIFVRWIVRHTYLL